MDVGDRRAGRSALGVLVAGAGGLVVWAVLAPRTDLSVHLETGWTAAVGLVPAVATVALLVWRLPRHGVTQVLTAMVLAHVLVLATGVAAEHGTGAQVVDRLLARVSETAWVATLPLIPVLVLLFPTGRPGRGIWRHVLRLQLVCVALLLVVGAFFIPVGGDPRGVVQVLAVACGGVLFGSCVAATVRLVATWRRLDGDERARGRLFVVLVSLMVLAYLAAPLLGRLPLPSRVTDHLAYALLVGGLPTAIGLSVLRHRLFGLEIVLRRTLLGLGAGAVLLSAYLLAALGVAGLGGPQVGEPASALLPALLVVSVLAPVTAVARRAVDRILYGDRSSPQRALRRLGDALAGTVAPTQVPELVAHSLVEALRVPWARVDLDDEGVSRPVAAAGVRSGGELVTTPLVRAGERLGAVVVETRAGQPRLAPSDLALLDAVAAQAAVALEAVQLTEQLLQSRERLVLGREQERARLRRDLHDDLSPALAGMALALDAGRRVLRDDPDAGEALLARVSTEARSCADVVRRLLVDLRPPGLAEVGLLAAVEQSASRLHRPGEFEVLVEAVEPLPPVSEAVEVAAYRIAGEALANAARHAGARRCTLRLHGGEELVVEVRDDGRGLEAADGTPAEGSGLGIPSMRERARDVGGTFALTSLPGAGTTVIARLPVLPVQRRP